MAGDALYDFVVLRAGEAEESRRLHPDWVTCARFHPASKGKTTLQYGRLEDGIVSTLVWQTIAGRRLKHHRKDNQDNTIDLLSLASLSGVPDLLTWHAYVGGAGPTFPQCFQT